MAVIRELVTRLGFTIDDAEARRYQRRLQNLGRRIRGFGRTMSLFVTAPIVGLGAAFVKAAADAEETESKFKEVFRGINDEADTMAKTLSKDFDLANVTAQEMLSTTGSLLVQFGFTEKAALDMSKQVAALSVDIASFENVQGGAERASQAITKALLGEREMLKGINKVALEEDVTKKIAILRAQGMTFETNRQAKAVATLALVTEQSERAIGDYARTSQSATNQARKMRQRFIELSVTFGKVLLPAATELLKVLTGVLEWFNSFSPSARKTIIIIAGITAALGPLLIVLGSIVGLLASIPVLIFAALAAVGVFAFLLLDDIQAFFEGRKSVAGMIVDVGKQVIDNIIVYLSATWLGWIKEHVTPWIKRAEALRAATTLPASAITRLIPSQEVLEPALRPALGPVAGLMASILSAMRPELAAAGGPVNIQMDMNLSGVSERTAGAVGQETAEAVQRLMGEAQSRGAITPRMSK